LVVHPFPFLSVCVASSYGIWLNWGCRNPFLEGIKAMGYVRTDAHPTARDPAHLWLGTTSSAPRKPAREDRAPSSCPSSRSSARQRRTLVHTTRAHLEPNARTRREVETAIRDFARFTKSRVARRLRRRWLRRANNALKSGVDIIVATPGRLSITWARPRATLIT